MQTKVWRSAGGITAITVLSRVAGYVRDKVMAYLMGAGMYSDAFIVAFRIPNMLRGLLAEGAGRLSIHLRAWVALIADLPLLDAARRRLGDRP